MKETQGRGKRDTNDRQENDKRETTREPNERQT